MGGEVKKQGGGRGRGRTRERDRCRTKCKKERRMEGGEGPGKSPLLSHRKRNRVSQVSSFL
eukprot:195008-Hanusia_phi.AAC.2